MDKAFPNGEILPTSNLRVFSFSELKAGTANFHPLTVLGEGVFGNVYKGWVEEKTFGPTKIGKGLAIAVKELKFGWKPKEKLFKTRNRKRIRIAWRSDVNFLGRLSHPNLVKLLGYCWEKKILFLVYEFIPKWSLGEHLFNREMEPLSWSNRLKIAIGAARSLAFLHSLEKPIIYGDFKASNILLDLNYNAKVSDIGLGKIVSDRNSQVTTRTIGNSQVTTRTIGSYGHAAHDYFDKGHVLYEKSDVYCFGVVLLEILSGQRLLDTTSHSLAYWAKSFLSDEENLFRIMDSQLQGKFPSKDAFQVAQITLRCLESDPMNRPSMKEVLETLEPLEQIEANKEPLEQIEANKFNFCIATVFRFLLNQV